MAQLPKLSEALKFGIHDHDLFWARGRNGDREHKWDTSLMASTLVAAFFFQCIYMDSYIYALKTSCTETMLHGDDARRR